MSDTDGSADDSNHSSEDEREGRSGKRAALTGRDRDTRRSAKQQEVGARSRTRLTLLAEVSRRLAESLDYETTLATVAGMSLPHFGSWSIVDLLDADGAIRRHAVVHPDAEKSEAARLLQERFAPRPGDSTGAALVMRTGRTERERNVINEARARGTCDPEYLALLIALDVRSFIIAPMVARGTVLGAITFVTTTDEADVVDDDVALAEDLASRAAMAIDNARLHLAASSSRAATLTAVQAAEEAGRRKSEFLATMSHEFRTPLNAILGYAQILDMGVLGPTTEAQHAHLERLHASAHHLLQLVDDVLDVAKVDADRLEVRQDLLMTGASVAAAMSLIHPQATAKGLRTVDLRADSPGVAYVGDEGRVRQILVNLLSNAVKFTPPGGEITIMCGATEQPDPGVHLGTSARNPPRTAARSSESEWAFIRVTDSGPGITPQFMSRLFEPFVQADGALTREKGGTGLGLAISRRLARRMGGDLTARSHLGDGATFTLWLPTPREKAPAPNIVQTQAAVTHRTPAYSSTIVKANAANLDDAAYAVLHAIGTRLAVDAETVAQRYVLALRADGRFPGAKELPSVQLRDHATPFVGLLASQLAILGETRGQDPELLGDGGHLQRLMAELHGAQRHRLGWSEADIEHEITLLFAEVERAVRAAVDTSATQDATGVGRATAETSAVSPSSARAAMQYALDVAHRVLEQSSHTTIRSFRFAREANGP